MNFEDPGCTWGRASAGEAPGHFAAITNQKPWHKSQNSCRKKYSIGFAGDSLMMQLHCDILPPK